MISNINKIIKQINNKSVNKIIINDNEQLFFYFSIKLKLIQKKKMEAKKCVKFINNLYKIIKNKK